MARLVRQVPGDHGKLQLDNDFWQFSLAVYARPGVAEECLALQEALGADVNLLLFCAWMGSRGIGLSADDISVAGGAVGRWHDDVIRPLRSVRRYVKTLTRADLENFRSRVKGIELEAEQVEQALLFNIAQRFSAAAARAGRNSVADNVARYIRMRSAGAGKDHSTPHLIEAASL